MSTTPLFRGTGTALATPFTADGAIDFEAFGRFIDAQCAAGVEALVPCGSTGESATMSRDEKLSVIAFTIERAAAQPGQRPRVIAGTGSNVTSDAIALTREVADLGADGALIVSPYYNRPSQHGLVAHYGAIADAVPNLPILLYNVPARTGGNIGAAATLELARRHGNIVGTKEASGNLDQCSEIIRDAPDGFALYSGEDSLTLPLIALGAEGVIAVVSNEVPKQFGDMVRAALTGNIAEARALHLALFELMRLNSIEANPVPVKEALALMGLFDAAVFRAPLAPLTDEHRAELCAGLERLGLLRV